MFWLARPPYARWAAATLLVAFALWNDLDHRRTESRPFAADDLASGSVVDAGDLEWREVPVGLIPEVDPLGRTTARSVARGEPLVSGLLADESLIPTGWWSLELPVPGPVAAGMRARVVVNEPPLATDALVAAVGSEGIFGGQRTALVAVPGEHADAVARAATIGAVLVLVAPGS